MTERTPISRWTRSDAIDGLAWRTPRDTRLLQG